MLNNSERSWIDGIVDDTESALRGVARLIEPARVDKATKEGINFSNRFMWVFRDNPQVRDKHVRLSVCHQSLMAVIACLYSKDVVVIAPVPSKKKEEQPPPYDSQLEELFNWRNRRRRIKSFMSLQTVAAESSTPADSTAIDTIGVSATSSVPIRSDLIKEDPPSDNLRSVSGIFMEPHHLFATPGRDTLRRPMSMDAVPISRIPTASTTSLIDLRRRDENKSIFIDSNASDRRIANLTGEAKFRQRQADEEATNSRLPYPMSPSDYMYESSVDFEENDARPNSKTPISYGLALPQFDRELPNLDTVVNDSGTTSVDKFNLPGLDSPRAGPLASGNDSQLSTSQETRDPSFDVANGLQLLTQQTRCMNAQYEHPPFSFSSFAPFFASDDDLPRTHTNHKTFTAPEYEGLESIADLAATVDGPSNQGEESQPDTTLNKGSMTQNTIRSPPVSPGRVRRGGRSWLMFHASRSDLGHYNG